MRHNIKISLFGAVCGAFLLASAASHATVISGLGAPGASALPLTDQVAFNPATDRCLKWTRRWNTRHGFARRRCVHWR
ncbi:hypothetical protein [Methylocystis echinoides]|uniref:Uncharacterized protein n=1 Tax=Methylocystis echinoides TaxID=29468 RepID=A0A9W6GVC2_9HYPH|nr:hypothetical protein [Methylocystis echinoides]GLI93565.1 hypothetical protein LMG27198_25570 [Methylocystis echinoides]